MVYTLSRALVPVDVEEFVHRPVPPERSTSGLRIALIKIGVVIALPAFLTGAEIGSELGLSRAAISIVSGCLVLSFICVLTGRVAARSRLPTAVIVQFAFGTQGAKLVNLSLALTLLGWFSVTVELFAQAARQLLSTWVDLGNAGYAILGGSLMVLTTIFGFKGLSRLSTLAVPLMLAVLCAMAVYAAGNSQSFSLDSGTGAGLTLGLAISAVVGGPAAGTVIFPDFARFAYSVKDGYTAAILSYAIAMPLVLLLVSVTAIAAGEKDLVILISSLGFGLSALIFLVLVSWTTNAGNLYSSSLYLSNIFASIEHRLVVLMAGALGVAAALLGITDYFIPFLVALGISVPPIAGIYVTDYFLRGQRYEVEALEHNVKVGIPAILGWLSGIAIAYWSSKGEIVLTSIPACDSILTSALIFALLSRVPRWIGELRK